MQSYRSGDFQVAVIKDRGTFKVARDIEVSLDYGDEIYEDFTLEELEHTAAFESQYDQLRGRY